MQHQGRTTALTEEVAALVGEAIGAEGVEKLREARIHCLEAAIELAAGHDSGTIDEEDYRPAWHELSATISNIYSSVAAIERAGVGGGDP